MNSNSEIECDGILDESQEYACKAYACLIGRVSVMVCPDGLDANKCEAGSGILCLTKAGTPYVLTARHLFRDEGEYPSLAIMNEFIDIRNAGDRVFLGQKRQGGEHDEEHEYIDVAIVTLADHAKSTIIQENIAGANIALDSETKDTDVVVIAGHPSFIRNKIIMQNNQQAIEGGGLQYITGVNHRDSLGRLEIAWDEAIIYNDPPQIPHFPIEEGVVFKQGHPAGMSGGGLWRVQGPQNRQEIWTPFKHCELIGIQSAFKESKKVALVEPVELWNTWLDEIEIRIDAHNDD